MKRERVELGTELCRWCGSEKSVFGYKDILKHNGDYILYTDHECLAMKETSSPNELAQKVLKNLTPNGDVSE